MEPLPDLKQAERRKEKMAYEILTGMIVGTQSRKGPADEKAVHATNKEGPTQFEQLSSDGEGARAPVGSNGGGQEGVFRLGITAAQGSSGANNQNSGGKETRGEGGRDRAAGKIQTLESFVSAEEDKKRPVEKRKAPPIALKERRPNSIESKRMKRKGGQNKGNI